MKISLCTFYICGTFFINFTLNANAKKNYRKSSNSNKNFVLKTQNNTKYLKDFHPQIYPSIKFLCICPRNYEYKKVIENLKPYRYNKGWVKLNHVSKKISLKNLRKQLSLIHNANISTIDSFCGKVVRENFEKNDIDPNYRIADNVEINMLKADILDELLEEKYTEGDEDFENLAEQYTN